MGEHLVEQNLGYYFLIILLNCTLYYHVYVYYD